MRIEVKIGLLLFVIGVAANRLTALPDSTAGFITGLSFSLAIVLLIVGLLPDKIYGKLPYRKWLIKNHKQGRD